jgi:hypothetical protein
MSFSIIAFTSIAAVAKRAKRDTDVWLDAILIFAWIVS